jgi:RNA polymerase sigma-32 factor
VPAKNDGSNLRTKNKPPADDTDDRASPNSDPVGSEVEGGEVGSLDFGADSQLQDSRLARPVSSYVMDSGVPAGGLFGPGTESPASSVIVESRLDGETHSAEVVGKEEDDDEEEEDDDDDDLAEPLDSEVQEYGETIQAESSPVSIARLDAMAIYLREIQRHPLLTPEETKALAIRFQETQDPAAAAKLVTSNLRLVVKIAYEYRRAYKNIMDLVQEGNIGLMHAVKRYDPYRGVKLSSYAAWWIRAYILRFVLNNWRLVKLGTTQAQRKLFFNLKRTRDHLRSMGIDPTNAEVAKQLNVPENDVNDMEIRLSAAEGSLDAPVGGGQDGVPSISKVETLATDGAGPETMLAQGELQLMLKEKLAGFRATLEKEKEIAIFDERLVADDPLTLQELGERFQISRERVRQLEQRLTSRLKLHLEREMGDATDLKSQ